MLSTVALDLHGLLLQLGANDELLRGRRLEVQNEHVRGYAARKCGDDEVC
jgi:hypothetical protein